MHYSSFVFDLLLFKVSLYEGRWSLWPTQVWQESAEVSHDKLLSWNASEIVDLEFWSWFYRSKLATLKTDKFLQVKLKIETGEDGKANRVHCYFINYKACECGAIFFLKILRSIIFCNHMFQIQGVCEHCEVQVGPHAEEDGDGGEGCHQPEQLPVFLQ